MFFKQQLYISAIIFESGHFHSASMFSKELSSWKMHIQQNPYTICIHSMAEISAVINPAFENHIAAQGKTQFDNCEIRIGTGKISYIK